MDRAITFRCLCGKVELALAPRRGTRQGNRLICHCRGCRAWPRLLRRPAFLDAGNGVDITQVAASRVTLRRGQAGIAGLRVTPRGVHRWHAACCDTPLCTTLPDPRWGVIGLVSACARDPEALGPITGRVQIPEGESLPERLAQTRGHPRRALVNAVALALASRIAGRGRDHPLYPAGRPIGALRNVERAEREAADA